MLRGSLKDILNLLTYHNDWQAKHKHPNVEQQQPDGVLLADDPGR